MWTTFFVFIITVHNLGQSLAAVPKKGKASSDVIKYPDEEVDDDIPEECKHLNYCTTKPSNYPQEMFNQMFKDYKSIELPSMVPVEVDLNNRIAGISEDNCDTEITYDPLYKVRDKREVWRTVIQVPENNLIQRVRLERCRYKNQKCFEKLTSNPNYETFCDETRNKWELLVHSGNSTEKIEVDLPVCCSCHYRLKKTFSMP